MKNSWGGTIFRYSWAVVLLVWIGVSVDVASSYRLAEHVNGEWSVMSPYSVVHLRVFLIGFALIAFSFGWLNFELNKRRVENKKHLQSEIESLREVVQRLRGIPDLMEKKQSVLQEGLDERKDVELELRSSLEEFKEIVQKYEGAKHKENLLKRIKRVSKQGHLSEVPEILDKQEVIL